VTNSYPETVPGPVHTVNLLHVFPALRWSRIWQDNDGRIRGVSFPECVISRTRRVNEHRRSALQSHREQQPTSALDGSVRRKASSKPPANTDSQFVHRRSGSRAAKRQPLGPLLWCSNRPDSCAEPGKDHTKRHDEKRARDHHIA
jgi:hypothetical protein